MTKIVLIGCGGKMGRVIAGCVAAREDCEIVAGVDVFPVAEAAFPIAASAAELPQEIVASADVIIDFSATAALTGTLTFAVEHRLPVIIGTTGFNDAEKAQIRTASEQTAVFFTGNMSLGINLLMALCKQAAAVLGDDFDVEILEKHHNQKVDAPSGTALMLADAVKEGLNYQPEYVYDRHAVRQKRDKKEIGISAIRGGTIVGEHEVIFAGRDEIITLSHSARSKELFAVGAVNAAVYLNGKPSGLYDMSDVIGAQK